MDSHAAQHLPAAGDTIGDREEHAAAEIVVVRPSQGWVAVDLPELWRYRELIWFLVWRDLKVRYKQTALGALWAIIQPFSTMVVFSVFFGKLARMPSDGVPYPLFSFAGLVLWSFFAQGLANAGGSLVTNQELIRKVYFPRLCIPVAAVLASVVDFAISFLMLLGMMMYFAVYPNGNIVWLPALALLTMTTALGTGLWLAASYVRYRDVRHILPFLVQLWLFLTPIAYPSSLLGEPWRTLYGLNPMVGVVEGFRWALLGTATAPGPMIAVSAATAILLLIGGLLYFRRMERSFADLI